MQIDEQLASFGRNETLPPASDPDQLFQRGVRRRRVRTLANAAGATALLGAVVAVVAVVTSPQQSVSVDPIQQSPPIDAASVGPAIVTGSPLLVEPVGDGAVVALPATGRRVCAAAVRGREVSMDSRWMIGDECAAQHGPDNSGNELFGTYATAHAAPNGDGAFAWGVTYGVVTSGTTVEALLDDGTRATATNLTVDELSRDGLELFVLPHQRPVVARLATGADGTTDLASGLGSDLVMAGHGRGLWEDELASAAAEAAANFAERALGWPSAEIDASPSARAEPGWVTVTGPDEQTISAFLMPIDGSWRLMQLGDDSLGFRTEPATGRTEIAFTTPPGATWGTAHLMLDGGTRTLLVDSQDLKTGRLHTPAEERTLIGAVVVFRNAQAQVVGATGYEF